MIKASLIDKNIYKIISTLNKKGFEAYLVGGAIRDLLLGVVPKDFDISTDATPKQICREFSHATIIGKRFKIVHIYLDNKIYEISTFRREPTKSELRRVSRRNRQNNLVWRDNYWGTLEDDAPRRDFSINALYYNPLSEKLIDPFDALKALENKKVECLGNPIVRFQEDPIRMIRALKLVAQYDFTLSPQIEEGIKRQKGQIFHVSKRRLFEEIIKITQKPFLSRTLSVAHKYDLLAFILPNISKSNIDTHIKLAQSYDQNFDKVNYSKAFVLALIAYPFIHYSITGDRNLRERWKPSFELERKILQTISKFYTPYTIMRRDSIIAKDIIISAQKLILSHKGRVKQFVYAQLLARIVGDV